MSIDERKFIAIVILTSALLGCSAHSFLFMLIDEYAIPAVVIYRLPLMIVIYGTTIALLCGVFGVFGGWDKNEKQEETSKGTPPP